MARIVIDAGHGGVEPGSIYEGRREKDDNLRLALAVGDILEKNGIEVVYTRTTDVYDSPLEKAEIGNQSGADFFVSIHRNAMPVPGSASGWRALYTVWKARRCAWRRTLTARWHGWDLQTWGSRNGQT